MNSYSTVKDEQGQCHPIPDWCKEMLRLHRLILLPVCGIVKRHSLPIPFSFARPSYSQIRGAFCLKICSIGSKRFVEIVSSVE